MIKKKWYQPFAIIMLAVGLLAGCTAEKTSEVESNEGVETTAQVVQTESVSQTEREKVFLSVEELKALLEDENLVIVDARGEDAYKGGHIPEAVTTSWQSLSTMDVDFATANWGAVTNKETVSKVISQLGIDETSQVVIYADTEKGWGEEGRIYWTFKMAGLTNIKILDGGVNVWNDKGESLSTKDSVVTPTNFVVSNLDKSQTIDTMTLNDELFNVKIIDTRDQDEYEGAIKFGEARGGHIPGAIHLGYKTLLNDDGSLKSDEALYELFESAGITKDDTVVAYCTAGIRSAYVVTILDMLGYENVKNYDESFYVWANNPDLKLGVMVKDKAFNYYTQNDLKVALESKQPLTLVDIQVPEDFEAHHIIGAIETNAFPAKTDEELLRLNSIVEKAKGSSEPIVIVCPRGAGGAQRSIEYLQQSGIPSAQLYILENGQEGWPYEDLLEK